MSLALLFPGQGTQHPTMLRWLDQHRDAAATLDLMAAQLGRDWRSRLDDAGWAQRNQVAQCLLTGIEVAAWQCLSRLLPPPLAIAGYSVGELPAFCAAGVIDAGAALRLAVDRADAMDRCVAGSDTGLMSVSGLRDGTLTQSCRRHGLAVAIELAADRWVLGGHSAALDRAAIELTQLGARCKRLSIGLASHTPWMAGAVPDFARSVRATRFTLPRVPLVCNFTGAMVRCESDLCSALAGQLAHPVPWTRCMELVAERRPRCVLEVGPGSSLSQLWNERYPEVPARSVDEFRSAEAVAAWVIGASGLR